MPAKTAKKKKSKSMPMAKTSAKKSTVKRTSSVSTASRVSKEPEVFYNDPKNLMVIGAVIVLFLVVVMLLSGGSGMSY